MEGPQGSPCAPGAVRGRGIQLSSEPGKLARQGQPRVTGRERGRVRSLPKPSPQPDTHGHRRLGCQTQPFAEIRHSDCSSRPANQAWGRSSGSPFPPHHSLIISYWDGGNSATLGRTTNTRRHCGMSNFGARGDLLGTVPT